MQLMANQSELNLKVISFYLGVFERSGEDSLQPGLGDLGGAGGHHSGGHFKAVFVREILRN